MASFKAKYGMQDRHVFQLQQALLGALKRYDDEGNQTLHPASLQKALETLGLNFGDEIVDKMMVMCRTNENEEFGKTMAEIVSRRYRHSISSLWT